MGKAVTSHSSLFPRLLMNVAVIVALVTFIIVLLLLFLLTVLGSIFMALESNGMEPLTILGIFGAVLFVILAVIVYVAHDYFMRLRHDVQRMSQSKRANQGPVDAFLDGLLHGDRQ
jgi:sterol desaturase/sphingolipid hydroxylase (fatty acid hydroxylase superfamily)